MTVKRMINTARSGYLMLRRYPRVPEQDGRGNVRRISIGHVLHMSPSAAT